MICWGQFAAALLWSSLATSRAELLDIAIKPFINEDPAQEVYQSCGLSGGSDCEGCEKWPKTPTSDPMKSFGPEDSTCQYTQCGLSEGEDRVYIDSQRLGTGCKLDTDDVAATIVEGNKCGYGFRRVCPEGPEGMDTAPVLVAQFKCSESDDCREQTDPAFTTFFEYGLRDGCVYSGLGLQQVVRHVPAPSWLFPGAAAGETPKVCVPCGHVGLPICPEGPYCANTRIFAPTVEPESHCQNKAAVECGITGKPSCHAFGVLPATVDPAGDGCIDALGYLPQFLLGKQPVNCGGTCAECPGDQDCAAFCTASGLGDLVTGPPVSPPVDPPVGSCVGLWGKCGGTGYTGATCCEAGLSCVQKKPSYSQCRPDGDTSPPADPPTDPPAGETCAGKWQQCGGYRFWQGPTCCTGDLECVVQREGFSQCRPPDAVPPVDPPVGETCAGKWQRCGGFRFWKGPTCCTGDLECVFQREGFSQCRPPDAGPPDDPVDPPPAAGCAAEWDKCGGSSRYTGPTCCQGGLTCVIKSPFYSQCLRASS